MENKENFEINENEFVDIQELFIIFYKSKLFILFFTFTVTVCSALYAFKLPNIYSSEALLEIKSNSSSGISSSLSQYSGLASMAGISMPGNESGDKGNLAIEIIKSRDFLKHIISYDDSLVKLFATKKYDHNLKKIIYDEDLYNIKNKSWVRLLSGNKKSIPSYLEAHKFYIEKTLNISRDKQSGFISISISHISPQFAEYFLTLIISQANEIARTDALDSSSKAINYLNTAALNTQVQEVRKSINSLIESQIETQMLASINDDFLLKVIDAPFIPEEKSNPQRILIIAIGFLASLFVSLGLVAMNFYILKKV